MAETQDMSAAILVEAKRAGRNCVCTAEARVSG